jgi:glycerol-3-phosphate dehydrogenase
VLNARDAAARGAAILTRTRVTSAARGADRWTIDLDGPDGRRQVTARGLVNAGGPWVGDIIAGTLGINSSERVRLVRGSHIVTRRLFDHDRAYIFQGGDGRIVFAIPYETDFTLIGTTDRDHDGPPGEVVCTPEEADYLRAAAGEYFREPIRAEDVVWTYSGVRPLYDDGAKSATAATRDYVLSLDADDGARRCSTSSAARSPPTGGSPKRRCRSWPRISRRPAARGRRGCRCPAATSATTRFRAWSAR